MSMSLVGARNSMKKRSDYALDNTVALEKERNNVNDAIDMQEDAAEKSALTTGAGLGLQVGLNATAATAAGTAGSTAAAATTTAGAASSLATVGTVLPYVGIGMLGMWALNEFF